MIHGPHCCPTRKGITGYGKPDAEVMLLGIAPGRTEIKDGRPFVGPSGKLADLSLRACGYDRADCYATNLICWWKDAPDPDEIEECADRLMQEIRQVRPRLIISLGALATERLVDRKISAARGSIIRPEDNNSAWFGEAAKELGITVLPTWHPAAILRVPSMGGDLVRDFKKIPRFLAGELEPPVIAPPTIVTDPDYAQYVFDTYLRYAGPVAADVETEDDEEDAFSRVICMAVTRCIDSSVYQSWVFTREALAGLRDWHEDGINWVFHNGQFDTQAIYRTFGVWLPIKEDTMLLSYTCDERPGYGESKEKRGAARGPGYHGLKTLAREYCSAGWYETDVKGTLGKSLEEMAQPQLIPSQLGPIVGEITQGELLNESGPETDSPWDSDSNEEQPLPSAKPKKAKKKPEIPMRLETPEEAEARYYAWLQRLHYYNALDAVYTLALLDRLPKDRDENNYYKILLPAANVYARIQYQGIPVNQHRLEILIAEFEPRIEAMRLDLQKQAWDLGYRNEPKLKRDLKARDEHEAQHGPGTWPGYEPINLGSNLQMARFMFGILGLVPVMFTKGGKPSTAAEHLDFLDHPFCSALKTHNQWEHVVGTYFRGSLKHIRSDGKFHSYPWLHGTVTGRRAWTEPAMQTFPQEYTVGKELTKIKEVVVPRGPNRVLIEADYDQIEVWLAAILSGDEHMLEDLTKPYYSTTGSTKPDYHSQVARSILLAKCDDGTDEMKATRQTAKTTTFGIEYLIRDKHLAHVINQPRHVAAQIIKRWYARYSTFEKWQKARLREARQIGEVTTPFGYRRRFPIILDEGADAQIVNHPIQSTGGTLTLLALTELYSTLQPWDTDVLLDVHDSLLFDAPVEHILPVLSEIRRVMSQKRFPDWPTLGVSIKIGSNWGQMIAEEEWLESYASTPALTLA